MSTPVFPKPPIILMLKNAISYEGHMDKIKGESGGGGGRGIRLGWGEVEGWGEKAYNCG